MQFRKDINGLRAFAVIAVVLFHFNESWVPGGFAGVDVFFVISGFLMTGIIFRGIEKGSFSILRFYFSRANRIVPSLAALCFVLLVFGWFYLTPLDYRVLGRHVVSSMGFFSNIAYWRESGYFDSASHAKWLLHTWSLSVEWQFYIIYPLVLVVMRKFMPIKAMKSAVLAGTVLGFIFCIIATYKWPSSSYYLLPTRVWELMLGGVAYLYPFNLNNQKKKLLEWAGLALVIGSYFLISKQSSWPGYLALSPVIGTFLILQSQRDNSIITGNAVFQRLGAWSYSIYLWHWPLVVAIYTYSLNDLFIYLGIALSILLGFLSHHFIEQIKFRNLHKASHCLKCKPVYFALILVGAGSVVFITKGLESRFNLSPDVALIKTELVMPLRNSGYCFYSFNNGYSQVDKKLGTDCYLGSNNAVSSTLLFGDSYAGHYEPFWDEVFKANDASFQSVVTNWCFPSLETRFTGPKTHLAYKQCLLNRAYLNENMHRYKNIIFAGSWGTILKKGFLSDAATVIERATELDINVIVMAAPIEYKTSPLNGFYKSVYLNIPFNINNIEENDFFNKKANLRLKEIAKKHSNAYFLDRNMLFEKSNTFNVDNNIIPYSLDGKHLSILGSKYSAKYFMGSEKYNELMRYFSL